MVKGVKHGKKGGLGSGRGAVPRKRTPGGSRSAGKETPRNREGKEIKGV